MKKLKYEGMPSYKVYSRYTNYLKNVSNHSCIYCTLMEDESPGSTFCIDHFKPKSIFPKLKSNCINLRLACPRCNSYKSNLWIKENDGCLRNCDECVSKVCKQNINRFIDNLNEEPSKHIYLYNDRIHAYSGSKVGQYTIDSLRLNRSQLVRLRNIRRYMENWVNELTSKKNNTLMELREMKLKRERLKTILSSDNLYTNIIYTVYEMLINQLESKLLLLEEEEQKILYLNSI